MDLSQISTEDLLALKSGDLSKVSTEGLIALKGGDQDYKKPAKAPDRSVLGPLSGVVGAGEAALSAVTGLGASAIGGVAGLASLPSSGVKGAADIVRKTQEALTYQPRTDAGQTGVDILSAPVEKVLRPTGRYIGEKIGGEAGGAIGEVLPEMALAASGYRPMVRGASSIADVVGQRLQGGAQNLMINALKPTPKQHISGDAAVAANELLKRDISPNTKGIVAIENRIAELQNEIANKISGSTAVIEKQKVLDRLIEIKDRVSKQANPEADIAAVEKSQAEFQRHPLIPGEHMPVQLAQQIKQGTYQELKGKYGEVGSAETQSQKALARGLKEEVASAVPEITPLNAEESALFKTLNVAERRAFLELNKDPVPLTGALRSPGAWAAMTADKSAAFKALLARTIYKLGSGMRKSETSPVSATPLWASGGGMLTGE